MIISSLQTEEGCSAQLYFGHMFIHSDTFEESPSFLHAEILEVAVATLVLLHFCAAEGSLQKGPWTQHKVGKQAAMHLGSS